MVTIREDQQASKLLDKTIFSEPFVNWEAAYNAMSTDERQAAESVAADRATRYARLSAYMSRRMSGGKHDDAVKRQNQAARKVRQALGYTYADDAISF